MPDADSKLLSLLEAADALQSSLEHGGGDEALRVRARLRDSVVRPLHRALPTAGLGAGAAGGSAEGPTAGSSPALGARLWSLAPAATELRAQLLEAPDLAEATAALQDLVAGLDHASSSSSHLAELGALQAALDQRIQVSKDGPYLVTNARTLCDWLGQPLPVRPQMALCRCGGSRLKPFCDGAHATNGFSDTKDSKRIPDRQDTYVGQQVTILDNRGTCQHSGFCTDRLATVFRQGKEPFVAPSGGRMDEIIRAVRDCPSGALSYASDTVEARGEVDYHGKRRPAIEVS